MALNLHTEISYEINDIRHPSTHLWCTQHQTTKRTNNANRNSYQILATCYIGFINIQWGRLSYNKWLFFKLVWIGKNRCNIKGSHQTEMQSPLFKTWHSEYSNNRSRSSIYFREVWNICQCMEVHAQNVLAYHHQLNGRYKKNKKKYFYHNFFKSYGLFFCSAMKFNIYP